MLGFGLGSLSIKISIGIGLLVLGLGYLLNFDWINQQVLGLLTGNHSNGIVERPVTIQWFFTNWNVLMMTGAIILTGAFVSKKYLHSKKRSHLLPSTEQSSAIFYTHRGQLPDHCRVVDQKLICDDLPSDLFKKPNPDDTLL